MRNSWVRRSLAGLVAFILAAAAATAFVHPGFLPRPHGQTGRGGATPHAATPHAGTSATPGVASPNPTAGRLTPGTLLIPKIGVKALIEPVTVDSNNDMAPPAKPTDVGWYSPGIAPGQAGDAVIDGHLDWYGVPKAVFYYLDRLKPGDEIDVVSENGVQLRFRVTDSTSVSRTAHPAGLFATSGAARLTLITCAGDWNASVGQYSRRLLVDASYVGTG